MPHLPSPPVDSIYDPMQLVLNGQTNDEGIAEYSYKDEQWQVIAFRRREPRTKIFFEVDSAAVAATDSPYNGKTVMQVTVVTEPCDEDIDTAEVVDWSSCLANAEELAALVGREGWAYWGRARQSLASGAEVGEKTPCHWILDGLCCPT